MDANQCGPGELSANSSWHGTHVAGIVAAAGGNAKGISGVAPAAKILPVRVLGACGGYSSDIEDGIVWAAGGTVAGLPVNPNPARVVNLSIGAVGTCSDSIQAAINSAYNAGAVVTVAAGNTNHPATEEVPANCQNVVVVGASGPSGSRASYSNYGSAVDVLAPGGEMTATDARGGIASTYNAGTKAPVSGEDYAYAQGTSMAAPHVAGVAALLMSKIGAAMTPQAVEASLKATAHSLSASCPEGCGAGLVDATAAMNSVIAPPVPGTFRAVAPFRALDTRGGAPPGPDSAVSFQVAGVGGVPADASAVVFNLTVAEAKSFGFITAFASGTNRPNASNVNFSAGQIVPNSVTVPIGSDGKVALFNRSGGTTHLLADISGYYLPGEPSVAGAFKSIDPVRFLDTRTSAAVRPDSAISFQVAGVNGIPKQVSAVVFNLTVAEAKSYGFVTAYASGTNRPNASNVNFSAGQIIPNSVTVPVGADGKVSLFNRSGGATQLLADVSGYYLPGLPTAAGAFQPVDPSRFIDTRTSSAVAPDGTVSFQVGGVNGIPANVSGVVFNLTVAQASSFGFVTAFASGTDIPNASNVNFNTGQIVPNSVTVPVGADGRVVLFNRSGGPTHLLADVSGYFLPQ
ncbi:S8 family serine peptidase [bacterium RCC_150]